MIKMGKKHIAHKNGIEFEWFEGSHTVNIFCNKKNTDVMSIGDFAKDSATLEEFKQSVKKYKGSCN